MKVLDLFSGIGGFALGLEAGFRRAGLRPAAGMETVGFCEINPFCRRVLAERFPEVPCHEDITDFAPEPGGADLVCGGFPCQDISSAGSGAGLAGERSGLWYEMLRVVRRVRPGWVLVENVPALRTRGADVVLAGLEKAGYTCRPLVVGACWVGAGHRRDRVWIVADAVGRGPSWRLGGSTHNGQATEAASGPGAFSDALPHADQSRLEQPHVPARPRQAGRGTPIRLRPGARLAGFRPAGARLGGTRLAASVHAAQHDWEPPRLRTDAKRLNPDWCEAYMGFPIGWTQVDGATPRKRIAALGNSVVPQLVELIGRAIADADRRLED